MSIAGNLVETVKYIRIGKHMHKDVVIEMSHKGFCKGKNCLTIQLKYLVVPHG